MGLIPPPGPARTWGLAVVGVPLVLVLLLALAGNLSGGGDNSARSGSSWLGSSGWPSASETTEVPDTSASYDATDTPVPYGSSDTPVPYYESDTPVPYDSATASGYSDTPAGPEGVVTAYFAAINSRDYATAWSLGGKNLDSDYDAFVTGFATTRSDTITITSVQGDDVALTLEALQTDGTTKTFDKVYTVSGGEIVKSTGNQRAER
ncbi:hypothetical protein ABZX85_35490 [Streptomyces sp. NPDC004539]|uniref:hypothetical protein n=1 Tax=Streptomyces sp. NPDC004539 TaxID=3154280 RepID=UPI0033BDE8A5